MDDAELGSVELEGSSTWTFKQPVDLSVGVHTGRAVAVNTTQQIQSVPSETNTSTVDLTPPTVQVVAPAEGSVINNPLPT